MSAWGPEPAFDWGTSMHETRRRADTHGNHKLYKLWAPSLSGSQPHSCTGNEAARARPSMAPLPEDGLGDEIREREVSQNVCARECVAEDGREIIRDKNEVTDTREKRCGGTAGRPNAWHCSRERRNKEQSFPHHRYSYLNRCPLDT